MLPHRRPTPPGDVLLHQFLEPEGVVTLTQSALAARMGVPVQRVNGIVRGRRAITAETALRLADALGTTPQFWLNLQANVDLWDACAALKRERAAR
jgi:addiction module HigA family antidote